MNEELLIKLKVDTSNVTTTINKLKNDVSNVNKQVNSLSSTSSSTSKTADAANKSTNKLYQAVGKLTERMKGLNSINFGNLTSTVAVTTAATHRLEKAISKLQKTSNKAPSANTGHFRNAFASLNPGSKLYEDVEWEGMDAAWNNFNDNMKEGIDGIKMNLSNAFSSIKNFKMPKSIAELKTTLSNIGASAKSGLGNITSGFKGIASGAKASASAVAAAGAALTAFVAILAAFTVAGVAAAFSVSKLGNETSQLAQRFGMSAQAFQEWSFIMERNGSTIDDLVGFQETLASEQAAVVAGSEDAAEAFKRLGLSQEQVVGSGQQQLFEDVVKRLQNIENQTEKTSIAYTLFGDEASRLMNVLNMSNAEMQEAINNYHLLGGSMSDDLIQKSNSLQGSIANMKQAWQGISNTLAQVFIPVVQKVVNWITKALVWVNLFLKTIFGLDLSANGASGSIDKATGSTNKYTGGLKAATKAAEALKRTTMGFDELNIVSDPNKGSSDSDSGSGAAAGMGDIPTLDNSMLSAADLGLESMYAWFEEYKGLIAQITTWSLILIGVILAVIGCMTVNIPMAILGFGMAGLGIAIGVKSGAFAEAWEAVKKVALAAWDWIKAIPGWFWEDICVPIGNFFKNLGVAIWDGVVAGWNAIINFITGIPGWINTNIIAPIVNFFKNLWNSITTGAKNAWEGIKNVFRIVSSWFDSTIIQPVGKFFSNMWNGAKSGASKAWEGIKSVFSSVTSWFSNVFTKAWDGVKKVFSTGGKIFDGIKDGIASTFKTVVNGLIGGINKVIAVPFNAINKVLNKVRSVSVAGIEPFKSLIKYNALSVPQIPKLATGGIATRSTIANIGEAGKEAILPLENNTGWMDTLADKIAERNSSPSKIVLKVGERELGWAAIDSINGITRQTGGLQLEW